jgi:chromosomal replication initiation ATPase DnaA
MPTLGNWSEVKRLGRNGRERVKGDERILGDTEFVLQILEQANERLDRRYELASRGWDETKVARRVADIYGIAADEMFRKGQNRRMAEARGLFCHWCRQELGLTVTALARMLSLTPAAVVYAARRGERSAANNDLLIEP